MHTRPIYHSCDAAIRGHVFFSFLALVLQKELADVCRADDFTVEWDDLIRDLDRLQKATIQKDGKHLTNPARLSWARSGRTFRLPASLCRPTGSNTPPDSHPPEM